MSKRATQEAMREVFASLDASTRKTLSMVMLRIKEEEGQSYGKIFQNTAAFAEGKLGGKVLFGADIQAVRTVNDYLKSCMLSPAMALENAALAKALLQAVELSLSLPDVERDEALRLAAVSGSKGPRPQAGMPAL